MGRLTTFGLIRRGGGSDPESDASRVSAVLGLPDNNWIDVDVKFGMDRFATAVVTFALSATQLADLAEIAAKVNEGAVGDVEVQVLEQLQSEQVAS